MSINIDDPLIYDKAVASHKKYKPHETISKSVEFHRLELLIGQYPYASRGVMTNEIIVSIGDLNELADNEL